jgi:hypothetical protein
MNVLKEKIKKIEAILSEVNIFDQVCSLGWKKADIDQSGKSNLENSVII